MTLAMATVAVALLGPATRAAHAAAVLPPLLPNIQQWQPGSGTGYAWTPGARIVVDSTDASALSADAQTFASDLGLDLGVAAPAIVTGTLADAQPGDIFETLGSTDPQLGAEGYTLAVAPVLQLSAPTASGAWWGTRTVLQLLRQSGALPAGMVRDWPVYQIRSVAASGNYLPMGWWFNMLRDLSYLKVNEFLLFGGTLPAAQEQQLVALAQRYHITVAPQPTDYPVVGSVTPPQFQLRDANGQTLPDNALDIGNPQAVAWALQRLSDQLNSYPGPVWFLGGDEYPQPCCRIDHTSMYPSLVAYAQQKWGPNAIADDAVRDFMNQADAVVHQHGKTMQMWNDSLFPGGVIQLNSDITIFDWFNPGTQSAAQLAANGNQLVNANQNLLYFDQHDARFPNTTPQVIWEQLTPSSFNDGSPTGTSGLPGGDTDPHLVGLQLSEFAVTSEPAGQLEEEMGPLERALAQRAWGSPELFPTWSQMQPALAAIGQAPGFVDTPTAGDEGTSSLPGARTVTFGTSQHAFAIRPDGSLVHAFWQPGQGCCAATETVAGAGSVAGQPVAFTSPDFNGQIHVFARGVDGHLHHWWTGAVSGGWQSDDWTAKAGAAGSPTLDLAGDPTGFAYGSQQHVFARGSDGHLHHWWWPGADPVSASDWGGKLTNTPVAYVWGSIQEVFARGDDGALHHWWWQPQDAGVHEESWGGQLAADASPAGFDYTETQQHVVGRDPSGHFVHWWYDHNVGQVERNDLTAMTGIGIAGDPGVFTYVFNGSVQQHFFARDAGSGHLHHWWWTPASGLQDDDWTAKASGTPVDPAGAPSGFDYRDAEQHVFALDGAGSLHHWFWIQSTNALLQDTWIGS